MNRSSKGYYRYQKERAIIHKKYICEHVYTWYNMSESHIGQLGKGKVHCSCYMCSSKVTGKYPQGWKHSDKKKLEREKDL